MQKPEVPAAAAAPCELRAAPLPVPLPGQRGFPPAGQLDRRGAGRRLWTRHLSVRSLSHANHQPEFGNLTEMSRLVICFQSVR